MTELPANTRVVFATNIQNQVMKNPDAATKFICCVADEVSITDLEKIYTKFFTNLNAVYTQKNLNN